MNEILNDIYKYIIINKNYKVFKKLEKEKGSAYSTLFEYKIRYLFSPDLKGPITYFNNFTINENLKVKVIIPKNNENDNPQFIQKLEISKGYLIEQDFGGKDLDFLIIYMDNNPKVFGFQVSTYKSEIFNTLEIIYITLLARLKIFFDVEIKKENAYFGYIFDFSRIKHHLYKNMLITCNQNKMSYSFYNSDDDCIYINEFIKTNNIYQISCCPLSKSNSSFVSNMHLESFFKPKKKNFYLTSGYTSTIIDILEKEINASIKSIKYIETKNFILNKSNYLFVSSNISGDLLIFFYVDINLVSKIINLNTKKVRGNTTEFSGLFDIYEINYNS